MERRWREFLADPGTDRHAVQFYRDEEFLVSAVLRWVAPAFEGGAAVLIATPAHRDAFRSALASAGHDVARLERAGVLVFEDADETLAAFASGSGLDVVRFKARIGSLLARASAPRDRVRAWGEMVDILRKRGEGRLAHELEALWNEVVDAEGIRLLCSYGVENLAPSTQAALGDLTASHSRLIPEADEEGLDLALRDALVDVFGLDEAAAVRSRYVHTRLHPVTMPASEAVLVGIMEDSPEQGERVLAATRRRLLRS